MYRLALESALRFEDDDPNGTRYPSVCANLRYFIAIRETTKGKTYSLKIIVNFKSKYQSTDMRKLGFENYIYVLEID